MNNLTGAAALDGPRGEGTVAPGTAYLVIVGQSGLNRRVLEVIVARAGPVTLGSALTGSGRINLAGNVLVDGIESFARAAPLAADVLSSLSLDAPDLVTWTPIEAGDQARVTGAIKIASPNAGAIDVGSATVDEGTHHNQALAPPAPIDIPGRIAAMSGAPTPILTPGVTLLPTGDSNATGRPTRRSSSTGSRW